MHVVKCTVCLYLPEINMNTSFGQITYCQPKKSSGTPSWELLYERESLEIMSHILTDGQRNLKNFNLLSLVPDLSVLAKDNYYYTGWLNWIGHHHLHHTCRDKVADFRRIGLGSIALNDMRVDEIEITGPVPNNLD